MEELLQTIAIMGAALAFLAKFSIDAYRRRNGNSRNPGNPMDLATAVEHIGARIEQTMERTERGREDRELKDLVRELVRVVHKLCELMEDRPCMARKQEKV